MTELEIDAFLTIVRTGSISSAAEALYVTQPALSRRITVLERELSCVLFRRKKGGRVIELTPAGEAFIAIAQRWQNVYQEAQKVKDVGRQQQIDIASVGSVSTYILPEVMLRFMAEIPQCSLRFHHCSSRESYQRVAQGEVDFALVSNDMFARGVETVPLFKEPMVLLASAQSAYGPEVHPSQLDPAREIRLPWNPEYDQWHDYWYEAGTRPYVQLDQMHLLEYFLIQPAVWSLVPNSVALAVEKKLAIKKICLRESPSDRYVYVVRRQMERHPEVDDFFSILLQHLQSLTGVETFPI